MNLEKPPSNNSTQIPFVGLRVRLLVGFTFAFSGVFSIAFYWFYNFASERAMDRIEDDLKATIQGAAQHVDIPQLLDFYRNAEPNGKGYSDDPRFEAQIAWLDVVNELEPRAFPFLFVRGNRPDTRRMPNNEMGEPRGSREIVYLVDLQWNRDPSKAASFLETAEGTPYHLGALDKGSLEIRPLYQDKFGSWVTAYAPLYLDTQEGKEIVAAIGLDFEASYVTDIQKAIRSRVWSAFALTYCSLFVLVYIVSRLFTQPILGLTATVEKIGEGNYDADLKQFYESRKFNDEISTLAIVFEMMVNKVRQREANLKQQVEDLKIKIDEAKRQKQVSEIVDTDFFRDLQVKAKDFRQRRGARAETE